MDRLFLGWSALIRTSEGWTVLCGVNRFQAIQRSRMDKVTIVFYQITGLSVKISNLVGYRFLSFYAFLLFLSYRRISGICFLLFDLIAESINRNWFFATNWFITKKLKYSFFLGGIKQRVAVPCDVSKWFVSLPKKHIFTPWW
jgi:hypothetical protein